MKYCVFAKHLQAIPLERVVDRVKAAGFEGLDLTVRPGGYVDPNYLGFEERVREAVKVVRGAGLEVPLFTTGLTLAEEAVAEGTLKLAGELGVPMVKLGYWPCGPGESGNAWSGARRDLDGLAKIAEKAGVKLLVHNHSGDYLTCTAWTVWMLVTDHDPKVVGAYLDPAHFTLEGGLSGWRFALEMLLPRMGMVAMKDGKFVDAPTGSGPQERRWVPVGTGNVRWREVYGILNGAEYGGHHGIWGSVHGEYQGRWSWRDLTAEEVLEQCGRDLVYLKGVESGV